MSAVALLWPMPRKQLELWPNNELNCVNDVAIGMPVPHSNTRRRAIQLIGNEAAYASLKRVQVVHEGDVQARPAIRSTRDACEFFRSYWTQCPTSDQERFVVACLNTKSFVQSVVVVTVGTLDASLVHPREVFKPAILEGASSVLLSHNHPSGDPTPSREDREVTRRMEQAGELLGIAVLDHIVYGDATGTLVSLREV